MPGADTSSPQALTSSLTSTVQTASWEIESIGGHSGGTGRFCFWHNDRMIVGQNGTDASFLSPAVTATSTMAGTGYMTNAGLMVTTIRVNSTRPLAQDADFYAGMQVQIGAEYRTVSAYQPGSESTMAGTISFHPAVRGPIPAGTALMIWLVVQPGTARPAIGLR